MKLCTATDLRRMVDQLEGQVPSKRDTNEGASCATRQLSALGRALSHSDSDLDNLAEILGHLSPDVPRGTGSILSAAGEPVPDYWFGVILAVRREYGDLAKETLRKWSQVSDRYDGRGFEQAWDQFDPGHPNPVTMGSVIKLAETRGWAGNNAVPATSTLSGSRFKLLDRAAIMAQPPLRSRVKGLLTETGIAAIYGPSGSGKSFLVIDLGVSIATGTKWFGHRTSACPVIYVMLEGEAALRNRVQAWEKHNGREIPPTFQAMVQPFQLAEVDQVADLAAILPNAGVVIIDTLNRAAPGLDENSSQDMGRILAGAKRIQEITSGLVLIVHHTGKDASKGLRGHSSLHAALDGAIEVERTANGRCWSATKVKDGEDGQKVAFKLQVLDLGVDADGDPITSCAVSSDTTAIFQRSPPTGAHQKAALTVIRGLLSASASFGRAGASPGEPCITFDDAVANAANSLAGLERKRRVSRARQAVQGLISGGHLKRGLDANGDEWLWL